LRFRLADQCDDGDLMQTAFDDARALLERDGELSECPGLRLRMEQMFTQEIGVIS
jgi:hypothetical protein